MGFPPFLLSVREYRAGGQVKAVNTAELQTAQTGSSAHSRPRRLKSHTALISLQITGWDPRRADRRARPPRGAALCIRAQLPTSERLHFRGRKTLKTCSGGGLKVLLSGASPREDSSCSVSDTGASGSCSNNKNWVCQSALLTPGSAPCSDAAGAPSRVVSATAPAAARGPPEPELTEFLTKAEKIPNNLHVMSNE
ncbi:hypothetical protein EYF80_015553 [Liparis tanakae]|uniref:Uncharacterized protein n=1 Tax=Liparis tanakae TaxID=230148 RepID=A0A4Z2I8X1_9TELE|nr:hypothetical protein EYF80_015553 [Liparis tanakae]